MHDNDEQSHTVKLNRGVVSLVCKVPRLDGACSVQGLASNFTTFRKERNVSLIASRRNRK